MLRTHTPEDAVFAAVYGAARDSLAESEDSEAIDAPTTLHLLASSPSLPHDPSPVLPLLLRHPSVQRLVESDPHTRLPRTVAAAALLGCTDAGVLLQLASAVFYRYFAAMQAAKIDKGKYLRDLERQSGPVLRMWQ